MNQLVFEPDFRVRVHTDDQGPVVAVVGELDSGTATELLEAFRSALAEADLHGVTLDLSQVTFIDSAGTRAVIMLEREARDHGTPLEVVAPPGEVTELLRMAGVVDRFQLRPGSRTAIDPESVLERVELELPCEPHAPARARAEIRDLLGGHDETQVGDVVLMTSEIVTNAVVHPKSRTDATVGLRIFTRRGGIRVEVDDGGGGFDPTVPSQPQPDRGRGLLLVDRFASRWGTDHLDDHRGARFLVWFEVDWSDHAAVRSLSEPN